MYAHSQHTNIPHPITGDDEEGVAVPGDSIDHHHHHHHHHHHMSYEDGPATGSIVSVDDVSPDSAYGGAVSDLAIQRNDVSSQLTLTFRGQVYVFNDVTPDKVQAVLLLLGGCELTSGSHGLESTSQGQRAMIVDYPGRCSQPQRAASLNRFRQKRRERCFDKKVRYGVRQEVALRMQRNKGQFTSSKKAEGADGWAGSQDSGHDDSSQETSCTHCGISSKCTPMMRRGPAGPRSLCNACGLFWANRGTLRELPKKSQDHSLTPLEQVEVEANDSDSGTAIHTHDTLVPFENGGDSTLIGEH
ncbi:hypothetical protein K2173_007886 [Erythroxylum novogranatense]|uniref:GATA transcription factor 25 n=1 Tax=Erythroxylum novogranatense TaxID=1862640 RepID=A0AAV8T6N8_9ROSI|nr:hypothetical protein K2173_007886 [Erythroxylum novogranatense]